LDTNIVLDWLHFDDPRIVPIRDDIAAGKLIALTHSLAIGELQRVLSYPGLKLDARRREEILRNYLAQTTRLDLETDLTRDRLNLPKGFPTCRDPNDQFLFALSFHGKADLLITYDKRVLKLARRVARFGFRIVQPKDYGAD